MKNLMRPHVLALSLLGLGVAACGKGGGGGGDCGPLTVTVDGAPVAGLTHGYAITMVQGGERTEQVQLFNHEAKCEDLVSRKGRTVPDGEESVRAFAGGSGTFGRGIGLDAHTQMGVDVELIGERPKNPGDKVAVCVASASFKPVAGKYKDKAVTVSGKLEGTYCGVMDFDAK